MDVKSTGCPSATGCGSTSSSGTSSPGRRCRRSPTPRATCRLGLVVAHGNLFGRGKRGIIGGRISTADSGAIVAYQDPAVFGRGCSTSSRANMQDQTIPEYSNMDSRSGEPVRETNLRSFGFNGQVRGRLVPAGEDQRGLVHRQYSVRWVRGKRAFPGSEQLPPPADGGVRAYAEAELTFDFRAREHAVMWGNALSFSVDYGRPRWAATRASRTGRRASITSTASAFLRRHNFILRGGAYLGTTSRSGPRTRRRRRPPRLPAPPVRGRHPAAHAGGVPLPALQHPQAGHPRACCSTTPPRSATANCPPLDPSGLLVLERPDGRRFSAPDLPAPPGSTPTATSTPRRAPGCASSCGSGRAGALALYPRWLPDSRGPHRAC